MWNLPRFWTLNTCIRFLQIPIACLIALYWVARVRPRVIFAVYPEIEFLCIAAVVTRISRLPLKLYLLDLIPSVEEKSVRGFFFRRFKQQAFHCASGIATISAGLSEFYSRELQRPCSVITHILPPLFMCSEERNEGNLFLGGGIYAINLQASMRIARTAVSLKKKMIYTSKTFRTQLGANGIASPFLCEMAYEKDADYHCALRRSDVLVLVLDWIEESGTNPSALETIFPTRTMEYLQSGVPILVHCPSDYFLARFFTEHACGVVVSVRSEVEIARAIEALATGQHLRKRIIDRAHETAALFSPKNVASQATQYVEG